MRQKVNCAQNKWNKQTNEQCIRFAFFLSVNGHSYHFVSFLLLPLSLVNLSMICSDFCERKKKIVLLLLLSENRLCNVKLTHILVHKEKTERQQWGENERQEEKKLWCQKIKRTSNNVKQTDLLNISITKEYWRHYMYIQTRTSHRFFVENQTHEDRASAREQEIEVQVGAPNEVKPSHTNASHRDHCTTYIFLWRDRSTFCFSLNIFSLRDDSIQCFASKLCVVFVFLPLPSINLKWM